MGDRAYRVRTTRLILGGSLPSCAVRRNWGSGIPSVTGVRLGRCEHEVQFVGVTDFASFVRGHCGPGELSFDEVMPANPLRVAVLQEHLARRAFRPLEQEWLAQVSILSR